jgi:hypothetical protein
MINYCVGVLVGVLVLIISDIIADSPSINQIGYHRSELKQMKSECEKDLSRNTECSIVVYYLPQAELISEGDPE